jgi:hypothetical protein
MDARQIQALSSANLLIGCDNSVKQEADKTLALSPFPPEQLHMMPNITPDPTTTPRRRVGLVHAGWDLGKTKESYQAAFTQSSPATANKSYCVQQISCW